MRQYVVEFIDHGDHVYAREAFSSPDDADAINRAHRLNLPTLGNGFDLMEGERLVYQHRQAGRL